MKRFSNPSKFAKLALGGLAAGVLCAAAQNIVTPVTLEQTAPALPADAAAAPAPPRAAEVEQTQTRPEASPPVEDYSEKIGSGLKERERRLTLLNEAMMKLREAGEMEDAARVEERIRALLAMPAPSQPNAQLKADVEQLRAKNDELIVQMVSMEEELKRLRGNTTAGPVATRRR